MRISRRQTDVLHCCFGGQWRPCEVTILLIRSGFEAGRVDGTLLGPYREAPSQPPSRNHRLRFPPDQAREPYGRWEVMMVQLRWMVGYIYAGARLPSRTQLSIPSSSRWETVQTLPLRLSPFCLFHYQLASLFTLLANSLLLPLITSCRSQLNISFCLSSPPSSSSSPP
jgi:hypothetical protein